MYDEEQKKFEKLHEDLYGKADGQLDLDMHGNISVRPIKEENNVNLGGITESGTYVLRDGKLVPGKGEVRE